MATIGVIGRRAFADRREAVAQRVVEDQITDGAKRQHARSFTQAVAPIGQIPVGIGQALDIGRACDVGQPESKITIRVDDLHARCKNQLVGQAGRGSQET